VEPAARSAAQGTDETFARYVLPELEVLLRVARSLTARSADAEDLVQDTLLRAYRSIDGFDGQHPRAWLFTILRNTHINRNRRRRPVLLDDQDAALERLAGTARTPTGEGPEGVVVGGEFDAVVAEALNRLPERYRQVVALVDIEGLNYAEAAEALAVPVGTVMSRLHRARSRMRQRLAAAGLAPRRKL
jgi:RNA polymerase sigma-70 factor (ECF subfamily)